MVFGATGVALRDATGPALVADGNEGGVVVGVLDVEALGVAGVEGDCDPTGGDGVEATLRASPTGPPQPWERSATPVAARTIPAMPSARRDAGTRDVPSGTSRCDACRPIIVAFLTHDRAFSVAPPRRQQPSDACASS